MPFAVYFNTLYLRVLTVRVLTSILPLNLVEGGLFMQFLIHFKITPEHRDTNFNHLKEKGEDAPPSVKLIGPWYALNQQAGWAIAEADDPVEIGKWMYAWSDLNELEIIPVVDDAGQRRILGP
jgi:hypothetical protein